MQKQHSGFTLIELLIVFAIIGILTVVIMPNLIQARSRAHDSATQSYVHQVVTGIESSRNTITQNLPPVGPECWEFVGTSGNPTYIKRCKYEPDLATDTYKVTAESVSGNVFQFDGSSIVIAASY